MSLVDSGSRAASLGQRKALERDRAALPEESLLSYSLLPPIEAVGLPAALCTADGRLLTTNREAKAIFGPGARTGIQLYTLAANAQEAQALEHALRSGQDQRRGWECETRIQGSEGADVVLRLTAIAVSAANPEETLWLLILQNQTHESLRARELEVYAAELSQLYQTSKQQLQTLAEALQSREHFFSLVSHELKTPLTSLKAALEMMGTFVDRSDKVGVSRATRTMERSVGRLERVIGDLLDLAEAKSGGLSLSFFPVDVYEVVEETLQDMAPSMRAKNLQVSRPSKWRSGPVVRGDHTRLRQIVDNLLSNAVKAAPLQGVVRISAGRALGHAWVRVVNPGVRLDPAIRGSLFDPFVKSPARGYSAGSGLGLSVVEALVRAHGGAIRVIAGRKQVAFSFTVPLWDPGGKQ